MKEYFAYIYLHYPVSDIFFPSLSSPRNIFTLIHTLPNNLVLLMIISDLFITIWFF